MTVTSTTNKERATGNGVTVVFPANIKIFDDTNIEVTTINNIDDTLANTLLLNDGGALGFSVVFDTQAETLTVTVNTAPTSAEDLQILRTLAQTQTTDFPRATKFPSVTTENALDKTTMILQDQQERLDRSLTLPVESSSASLVLPPPSADQILAWNSAGDAITNISIADVSTSIDTIITAIAVNDILKWDGSIWVNSQESVFDIDALPEVVTLDPAADFMPIYDTSGVVTAKIKPDNIGFSGAWVALETQTASSDTEIDFVTGIDSTYKTYVIIGGDIIPSVDADHLKLRTSTDGGSSFDSGAGNYKYAVNGITQAGSTDNFTSVAATSMHLIRDCGTGSGEIAEFSLTVSNPSNISAKTLVSVKSNQINDGDLFVSRSGGGLRNATGVVNALRLLFDTGNIVSGTFTLYGISGA